MTVRTDDLNLPRTSGDFEAAQRDCDAIIDAVGGVFVGNRILLRKVLAAALANGHVLFEDLPGLGKTLLAKVIARSIGCGFTRVQFTPDLLPADILGTKIWRQNDGTFEIVKGPIFTRVLLADEINRAPPKTQSALLEAMEERQVTIEGETYPIGSPFIVLATQNPIEQEGTYPLPEAQLDRFMLRLSTGYPGSLEAEQEILSRRITWRSDDPSSSVSDVVEADRFRQLQDLVESAVYVDPTILEYIGRLVRSTREHAKIEVGASPRGGLALLKAARALAVIHGRDFVVPDDVKSVATDALSHRVILRTEIVIEGTVDSSVVQEIVDSTPVPTELKRKPAPA
ncbi:MAG: MoxR family ATPase [Chloroflexi bacterium]|nr:MoxR family ATPase [Chloroflexota bacterium]